MTTLTRREVRARRARLRGLLHLAVVFLLGALALLIATGFVVGLAYVVGV